MPGFRKAQLVPYEKEEGVKYYSGKVLYESKLVVEASMLRPGLKANIDLGEILETARVILNGKEVGILWKEPYTWSNSTSHYSRDSRLIEAGLLCPVHINFSKG